MDKEIIKMFEMFGKLNPDFKIKLNESDTFSDTFGGDTFDASITQSTANPVPTSNSNNSQVNNVQSVLSANKYSKNDSQSFGGIFDDGTLSVGELKMAIGIVTHSKNKEEAMAKLKNAGADVLKVGVGLIGVGAVVFAGGALAAVAGSAVVVGGGMAATASDTLNVFKKLFAPKKKGEEKTPNDFMKMLSIDTDVSVLLDDNIEFAFITYAQQLLDSMPDTDPLPNFFEELKKFIKEKYSSVYNLTNT